MSKKRGAATPAQKIPSVPSGKVVAQPKPTAVFNVRDLATFALLLWVTLAVYWPALQGGPLWDDDSHITRPELQSLHGLWRIWFDVGAAPQYYPLLHSAFWFEHQMWGDQALGYHLTNIVLHVIAAGLLFLIVNFLRK